MNEISKIENNPIIEKEEKDLPIYFTIGFVSGIILINILLEIYTIAIKY